MQAEKQKINKPEKTNLHVCIQHALLNEIIDGVPMEATHATERTLRG